MCEMGNQVMFGISGGVIRNLKTGVDIPFEKKEGVYVFSMWVPPLEQAASTFVGQP